MVFMRAGRGDRVLSFNSPGVFFPYNTNNRRAIFSLKILIFTQRPTASLNPPQLPKARRIAADSAPARQSRPAQPVHHCPCIPGHASAPITNAAAASRASQTAGTGTDRARESRS